MWPKLNLRKIGGDLFRGARDLVDANTAEDQRKRMAAGQARMYQDQQKQLQAQRVQQLQRQTQQIQSAVRNPVGAAFNAVGSIPQVKNYFKPDANKVRVRDVVRELPDAAGQIGNFAKSMAKPFTETADYAAQSGLAAVTRGKTAEALRKGRDESYQQSFARPAARVTGVVAPYVVPGLRQVQETQDIIDQGKNQKRVDDLVAQSRQIKNDQLSGKISKQEADKRFTATQKEMGNSGKLDRGTQKLKDLGAINPDGTEKTGLETGLGVGGDFLTLYTLGRNPASGAGIKNAAEKVGSTVFKQAAKEIGYSNILNTAGQVATGIGNRESWGDIAKDVLLSTGINTAAMGLGYGYNAAKAKGMDTPQSGTYKQVPGGKVATDQPRVQGRYANKPKAETNKPFTPLDKNMQEGMTRFEKLDAATPVPQGAVRVYSGGKAGATGDWAFTDPKELANYHNNVLGKGDTLKFHDVLPGDLIPTDRPGVVRINPEVQKAVTTGRKSISLGAKTPTDSGVSYQTAPKGDVPETTRVFIKSKFRDGGGYADIPVIRKVENKTLYQGGSADGRQFWTANKKYAEQFGEVTKKTGTFYEVDNGNRMTSVYVDAANQPKAKVRPVSETNKLMQEGKIKAKVANDTGESFQMAPRASKDQLKAQVEASQYALDANPAAGLMKYANKRTMELPENLGKGGKFGTKGDSIVDELGFRDAEEARAAFEQYAMQREMHQRLVDEYKTVASTAKKATIKETKKAVVKGVAPKEKPALAAITTEQGPVSQSEIQRLMKESADEFKNRGIDVPAPRVEILGKPVKDARVAEVLQSISRARSGVDANLVTADIQAAARKAGVKLDQGFIDRYQAGKLLPNEAGVGKKIKEITDKIFEQQQKLDPTIEYRNNYVPQVYAQADEIVEDAAQRLQTATGAANPRAFNTYAEAAQFGLTPKYSSLDQIIGTNAGSAARATVNRQAVEKGLKSGIFDVYPDKGWSPVVGFMDNQGNQIFAQKSVADTLNGITQKGTGGLEKGLSKTAKLSGKAQDIMLQGGIPGTNANFFVFGQGVKDTTRNIGKAITLRPGQAVKQEINLIGDFFRGKNGTIQRFAKPENQAFVKELADRGLYINPQTSISNVGKSGLEKSWDWLGNNPTFGRYMPNRMLSTAQEVYQQSAKKLGHQAALDLAAETTKRFTGQVDEIMKGRSNLTSDAIASVAFAPKYRESIVTALNNVAKSVYPKNWADKTYAPSRQLLAGMAATLAGYEALNQQITGHSMFENRKGQELSLEIPYGEKDAKGNQKVINIPFMPGFMTLPRAAFNAGQDILKGDVQGVVGEASKALSAPLQTAGRVLANQDYFGRPIYIDQATADKEGIAPDSLGSAAGKVGAYVGGQFSPAWVRGGIDAAQGKPKEQAIATALEAPVRFGKINPEQTAYFESKDAFYKGLNKNEKALFDKMNPVKKNSRGELIQGDKLPLASAANYGDLVANQEFAKKYQDYKKSQPNHDPLWDLEPNQLRSYMQAQVISKNDPGGDSTTVRKLYDRLPDDFFDKRSAYFNDLKAKGVLGKDDPNYKSRPKMPKELEGFADSYQTLPYGTGARSKALRSDLGQQYIAYLNANKLYNNQERADLGLPPLEDSSSSYASKGGSGGSKARAANPDKYRISETAKGKVTKAKFNKPGALAKVKLSDAKLAKAKTSTTKSRV